MWPKEPGYKGKTQQHGFTQVIKCLCVAYYSTGIFFYKESLFPKDFFKKAVYLSNQNFESTRQSLFSLSLSLSGTSVFNFILLTFFTPNSMSQFDEAWWLAALGNGHKPTTTMVSVSENQRFFLSISISLPSVRPLNQIQLVFLTPVMFIQDLFLPESFQHNKKYQIWFLWAFQRRQHLVQEG